MTSNDQWDGLAVGFRNSTGMGAPFDAFRAAKNAGFELIPVFGPICVARIGKQILFDASLPVREQHAAVARCLAAALLERHRYELTEERIEAQARELMLPRDEFYGDYLHVDDLDEFDALHPNVPFAWIADRIEEIERQELRLSSIVELRPRRRDEAAL